MDRANAYQVMGRAISAACMAALLSACAGTGDGSNAQAAAHAEGALFDSGHLLSMKERRVARHRAPEMKFGVTFTQDYAMRMVTTSPDRLDARCARMAASPVGTDVALTACEEAFVRDGATDESRAQAAYHKALIHTAFYEYEAAMTAAEAALALDPSLADARFARAAALIHMDRMEAAKAAIDEGLEGDSRNAHYGYFLRGIIHDRRNEYVPAYQDFQKALALKPGWLPARRRLAFVSDSTAVQSYIASGGD